MNPRVTSILVHQLEVSLSTHKDCKGRFFNNLKFLLFKLEKIEPLNNGNTERILPFLQMIKFSNLRLFMYDKPFGITSDKKFQRILKISGTISFLQFTDEIFCLKLFTLAANYKFKQRSTVMALYTVEEL